MSSDGVVPNRELKVISIPEGLDQDRVDAALARMLGLSRSAVVALIDNEEISRNGKPVTKSDKVSTSDVLEILMPAAKSAPSLTSTGLWRCLQQQQKHWQRRQGGPACAAAVGARLEHAASPPARTQRLRQRGLQP